MNRCTISLLNLVPESELRRKKMGMLEFSPESLATISSFFSGLEERPDLNKKANGTVRRNP
jgi:hypothetical protein